MNKKLIKEFFIFTFIIMISSWGFAALLSQTIRLNLLDNILLKILYVLGGFYLTISSFIVLKRNNRIICFKDWIKNIFAFNHGFKIYTLVILFFVIYFGIGCLLNDFKIGVFIFMQLIFIIFILFGGGNKEAGWRNDFITRTWKKYNFNVVTIITEIIWWLWHSPIFFY